MWKKSGKPKPETIQKAEAFLESGAAEKALQLLAGAVHGMGFNQHFYELFGRVLLENNQEVNAGRFLFLSGSTKQEHQAAIETYIQRNHDPGNFRQLHSTFPESARTIWKLEKFPDTVAEQLRTLGFPENIQDNFIGGIEEVPHP